MTQEMSVIYTNEDGEEFRYMEEVLTDRDAEVKLIYIGDDDNPKYPFVTVNKEGYILACKKIFKIKQPELKQWTYETVPVPPFAVKLKSLYLETFTVLSVKKQGVIITELGFKSYSDLLKYYILVDKDKNESPCGVVV